MHYQTLFKATLLSAIFYFHSKYTVCRTLSSIIPDLEPLLSGIASLVILGEIAVVYSFLNLPKVVFRLLILALGRYRVIPISTKAFRIHLKTCFISSILINMWWNCQLPLCWIFSCTLFSPAFIWKHLVYQTNKWKHYTFRVLARKYRFYMVRN